MLKAEPGARVRVAPAVPLPVVPALTVLLKWDAPRVAAKVAPEATEMAVLPREAV